MRSWRYLIAINIAALVSMGQAQPPIPKGEISVLSKFVGSSIELPEQEYYNIFPGIDGFIRAQIYEQDDGYVARIRTRRGWRNRKLTREDFSNIGLSIDLMGPIDPAVVAELSGRTAFEATSREMSEIPAGVFIRLYGDGTVLGKGKFQRFEGADFVILHRRGRTSTVALKNVDLVRYRELPQPDLLKDARAAGGSAVAGVAIAEGWNRISSVADFDSRWYHNFFGATAGLLVSPWVIRWFQNRRAQVHDIGISSETRRKITNYSLSSYQ